MEKLLINLDGASHGNPGEAAVGAVLMDEHGNIVEEISKAIGRATSDVADYRALIEAAKASLNHEPSRAIFFTHSQLVANQINGTARVRQPHLENLNQIAQDLLGRLNEWSVRHVERSVNWNAHRLAEKALSIGSAVESILAPKTPKDAFYEEFYKKLDLLSKKDQKKVLEFANHLLHKGRG